MFRIGLGPERRVRALETFSEERAMPDEQKKDQVPETFDDAAERSVEAGIADETAAYDKAMKQDGTSTSSAPPTADDLGDFA